MKYWSLWNLANLHAFSRSLRQTINFGRHPRHIRSSVIDFADEVLFSSRKPVLILITKTAHRLKTGVDFKEIINRTNHVQR